MNLFSLAAVAGVAVFISDFSFFDFCALVL